MFDFIVKIKKHKIKSKFLEINIPKSYEICHFLIYNYKNIKIKFEFYDKFINKKKANKVFIFLLNIINILYNKSINKLNIKIINYNQPKTIPHDNIFRPFNINSGYTILQNKYKSTVVVFRKNEMYKVLIHELIHAFRIGDFNFIIKEIDEKYPNNGNNLINEAITETYACILYNNLRKGNFKDNIEKEKLYSIKLAEFIKYIIKDTIQISNIVSYTILKAILIQDNYNFIKNFNNKKYIQSILINNDNIKPINHNFKIIKFTHPGI